MVGDTSGPIGTAYVLDIGTIGRDTAIYVDDFLQGSKPGDLLVEQRAKFGFVTDCYS